MNGKLEEQTARVYAAQIINVLETIHSNNIMHRDLKPENILMTKELNLKVVIIAISYKFRSTSETLTT